MNLNQRWQRVLQGTVAVLSLALLSSCGGGKREAFHPGHMYVFGDEFSYVNINQNPATLSRYTVNTWIPVVSGATQSYNPDAYPLWTQFLAANYGKYRTPCDFSDPAAMSMCAESGADVSAVITKINSKSFQKDELIVIMAGTRDILNAYQSFKIGGSIDSLATTLKNTGIALGQKINAITDTGARVAVVTIPDIGLSPYAVSEAGGVGNLRNYGQAMDCSADYRPNPGEYSKALSYLTSCFNSGLRGINGIKNDGKKIALISTFDWSILVARSPSTYGIADPLNPACFVANTPPLSTTPETCYYDAVTDANNPTTTAVSNPLAYLWSFGPWFGPGGHVLLGQRAIYQVNYNWGE